MAYTKTAWVPKADPVISAVLLNKIEQGIFDSTTTSDASVQSINSISPTSGVMTLDKTSFPDSALGANDGMDKIDNTADADKPISTLTQTALDLKFEKTDHLTVSSGTPATDAGSPIVLDGTGKICLFKL